MVAAYLVERKKGRIETIAPVLARIFTPLFLVVLLSLLVAMLVTGRAPLRGPGVAHPGSIFSWWWCWG